MSGGSAHICSDENECFRCLDNDTIPWGAASAFGAIPIPQFLFGLARHRLPPELVRYEDPATLVFSLDRFLPPFIDAEIQRIWIIDGGLVVTLGRGGADLPPASEGPHGD